MLISGNGSARKRKKSGFKAEPDKGKVLLAGQEGYSSGPVISDKTVAKQIEPSPWRRSFFNLAL